MNRTYWLSVVAALFLLLCSIVYQDAWNGKQYTFLSLVYHAYSKESLIIERVSIKDILLGYDRSYLWMFCPIIAGIPCVLNQRVERFVLFRSSKNAYCFSKFISNLFLSGFILVMAYVMFFCFGIILSNEEFWLIELVKKLMSVFWWGMVNAIPSLILAEFVKNKYLILCIPFVWNYFLQNFVGNRIPFEIWEYISPYNYQMLFLNEGNKRNVQLILSICYMVICAVFIKLSMERRCDCGQK